MRNLLCFFFFISSILVSCSKDGNDDDPAEGEEVKMSISSCYVVKNDNSQSENFASPIGLYLLSTLRTGIRPVWLADNGRLQFPYMWKNQERYILIALTGPVIIQKRWR